MFANIRKHQKWLWVLISAAVIISFVVYFNPQVQQGGFGGGGRSNVGMIDGQMITFDEYQDAKAEAFIFHFLSYGQWPDQDANARQLGLNVESETRTRLFLEKKLKQANIVVSDEAVADYIATSFGDRETKVFRKEVYDNFINMLKNRGMDARDFERYVRHQVGISHLASLASIPGKLIAPQEIEKAYREQNQKADTIAAFVIATNLLSKVQVTDDALNTFYSNRMSMYFLPERVQLAYVAFPVSNYFGTVEQQLATRTNLNDELNKIYQERGTNFFTDPIGQVLTADAAKERIRNELRDDLAKVEAQKAAIDFANKVLEEQAPTNNPSAGLSKAAAAANLPVLMTPPFPEYETPDELKAPAQLGTLAFALTPEEPVIPEPIVGESNVYVMALQQRVPRQVQELATIRERVIENFKTAETTKMAREMGNAFAASLTNVANSEDFGRRAVDAGLTIMNLPPFPKAGPNIPELEARQDGATIRSVAFTLKEGGHSSFMPTRDGGFVVYVEKISEATDEEVKQGLASFAEKYRRDKASAAFTEWMQAEQKKSQISMATDEKAEPAEGGM